MYDAVQGQRLGTDEQGGWGQKNIGRAHWTGERVSVFSKCRYHLSERLFVRGRISRGRRSTQHILEEGGGRRPTPVCFTRPASIGSFASQNYPVFTAGCISPDAQVSVSGREERGDEA